MNNLYCSTEGEIYRYIDKHMNIWQYLCIYESVIYIIPALQMKHRIKAVEAIWDTCICIPAIHRPYFLAVKYMEKYHRHHLKFLTFYKLSWNNSLLESTASNLRKEISMSLFCLVRFLLDAIHFINNSHILVFWIFKMWSDVFNFLLLLVNF